MVTIRLVNMAPASLKWPNIGLTQLKAAVERRFERSEVQISIDYLNFYFAEFLGADPYKAFTQTHTSKGYTYLEWFFRSVAFPGLPENQTEFFQQEGLEFSRVRLSGENFENKRKILYANELLQKRLVLDAFIEQLIVSRGLHEAGIVGFSSMFNQNIPVLAVARKLKEINPRVIILVGGSNCESPMGEEIVRNFDFIDFVFSGPSMKSFPLFINHYMNGDIAGMNKINGVFSRSNLHQVVYPPHRNNNSGEFILPAGDEMAFHEYPEINYDDFLAYFETFSHLELPQPGLYLETSRGCWYGEKAHCTFCSLNATGMKYHSASTETALRHFENVVGKYSDRVKYYVAVDNIMPRTFPEQVLSQFSWENEVDIFYEVKSDLTRENLIAMLAAGVKSVQPGIEALDNSLLKLMKKGVSSTQNVRFLRDSTELGMKLLWNVLLGFPGETETPYLHYKEAFPFLVHLHPPSAVGGIYFGRYSPYEMYREQYGLQLQPSSVYNLLYPPLGEESFSKFVYFFQDQNMDSDFLMNRRKWQGGIEALVEQWRTRYYCKDGKLPPDLYFEKDGLTICDTRSGNQRFHKIDPDQRRILDSLKEPTSLSKLRNSVADVSDTLFDIHIQGLIEQGLVFHDQRRTFISLVFDNPVRKAEPVKEYFFYS